MTDQTQWMLNGGKCGVCGDPWNAPAPRDHELGGRFTPAHAIIARRYRRGGVVPVVVELTASHAGHFEFRVCPVLHDPVSDSSRDPDPDCLDRNVLPLVAGEGTRPSSRRYVVGPRATRMHAVEVQLPPELDCKHCLFQWKYHTGKHSHDQ